MSGAKETMASILRQIVAGPRVKHAETGLDLVYVTDNIIAMSMPAAEYPKMYYRNPLPKVVEFLDKEHGEDWAVWEFRAEGTGYDDSAFHDRVFHSPWPDHHPPPFGLIPNIMASMRNHLKKGPEKVAVVHCKAGKGRTGTVTCSYLISEENWTKEAALERFTKKRMRPQFGAGVSIPSQLRYVDYVAQWASPKYNKIYKERSVEVAEVHVWGLRENVKISILGYVDEGKTIKNFHNFTKSEKVIVDASEDKNSQMVIYRPSSKIILPSNDVCIDMEKRTKAAAGWTFVSALSHCWWNCYFEGEGATSGVFSQDWDKMDGLKGTLRKGIRIFDKIQIVWKVVEEERIIEEPKPDEPVAGTAQAEEQRGETPSMDPTAHRDLGLRPADKEDDNSEYEVSNTGSLANNMKDLLHDAERQGEQEILGDDNSSVKPDDSISRAGDSPSTHGPSRKSTVSVVSPSISNWTTSVSSADTATYQTPAEEKDQLNIKRVASPESLPPQESDSGAIVASSADKNPHVITSTVPGTGDLQSTEPEGDATLNQRIGTLRHDEPKEMAN